MNPSFVAWISAGLALGALFGQLVLGDLAIGVGFGLSWGIMLFFLFGKR